MKHIRASIMIFLGAAGLPASGQPVSDSVNAYNAGNYIAAHENFKPLAEQGFASAQTNLGVMYLNGQGVLQDYAKAVKWYRLAAEQGHATAQYNLGLTYGRGLGVPLSNVKAHMSANISVANGGDASLRDFIAENMTSAQIAEAQRLARICMASDYQDCD